MTKTNNKVHITFPAFTRKETIEKIEAVCWVMSKHGKRTWEASNVLREFLEILRSEGHQVESQNFGYIFRWFYKQNYATVLHNGKRLVGFELHPNVVLPTTYQVFRPAAAPAMNGSGPELPTFLEPPQPPHRIDHLNDLLQEWWEEAPEEYAPWADRVIDQLENRPGRQGPT